MNNKKTYDYLSNTLEKLDFSLDDKSMPEIVFLDNQTTHLHPKHYIALEFAEIYEADAVFFRYYDDNRHCVPQVYFYDNSLRDRNKEQIAEIHKKVYSSCQVPLICFIDKTTITLYDCRKPVTEKEGVISNDSCIFKMVNLNNLESLNYYFSAKHLKYGFFWETEEASKSFLNNQSAYEKLITVLTDIRSRYINDTKDISTDFADDLLFKCILIKYLEENGKDEKTNKNYARDFYKNNNLGEDTSLNEILNDGKILDLLDSLESHFNGNVFSIEGSSRELLKKIDLSHLAEHLEGRLNTNTQLTLWNIYSFKDIPIELISNFYEEFIPKTEENKGTVYTPSFLVNLLIDECLPLSSKKEDSIFDVKLIDVSCGSGIFITSAYKRLVQRWRIAKGIDGKPVAKEKIKLTDVKKILSKNIFGVDKNETAVKLTKFSLQLALCQILPNNELWNWSEEKVFDNLTDNIFENDFFDFLVEKKELHDTFDLVIGNPPFESIGKEKYIEYSNKLASIDFKFKTEIPKYQLALMFLETSHLLLKEKGDLCFIQKSTSLLYNKNDKSQQFKNHIFNQFYVHQIIDFTLLKNVLFKSSKVKKGNNISKNKSGSVSVESIAVFYKKEKKTDYTTNHIVSRLLKNTKDGLFFEFDYYDFYEVPKIKSLRDENIWRCNLLGGNRLNHLINDLNDRTTSQTNLEDFLFNHLKIKNENYRSGFKIGNQSKKADYITQNKVLLGKNFSLDKLSFVKYSENQKFESPRSIGLFKSPFLIIKSTINENKTPLLLSLDEDFAYDINIIGIASSNVNELKRIKDILNKNQRVNALQTLSTCAQFFLGSTSAIQKQDIDKWTIPLDGDEIKLSPSEKIILDDALDYIYPSWHEGEKAKINKSIKDPNVLLEFAYTYCESINAVYKQKGKELRLKNIIEGKAFYACEFYYGLEDIQHQFIESDIEINKLLKEQVGSNVFYNKIMRLYANKNTVTLIKPKNLRYWLKSIALRDADDTFDDILESGF
jgi:methylase of polypeptide subunit release factors